MKQWDVFISHASEDAESVARPLADALRRRGIEVWLDGSELKIGDSLNEKIDEGLANSFYGVLIVSPNFIAKQWPRRELNALMAKEERGRKSSCRCGTTWTRNSFLPIRPCWQIAWREIPVAALTRSQMMFHTSFSTQRTRRYRRNAEDSRRALCNF